MKLGAIFPVNGPYVSHGVTVLDVFQTGKLASNVLLAISVQIYEWRGLCTVKCFSCSVWQWVVQMPDHFEHV